MGGEFASASDFGGKDGCGHRDECGLGGGWVERRQQEFEAG